MQDPARGEAGLRRKAIVLGTAIALLALVVGSIFGDRGILSLVAQRRQLEALRQQMQALRVENARLAAEITALRTSPRAIERIAREELALARPDETVFLIRREPPR
jgi:cell division protein FtsB